MLKIKVDSRNLNKYINDIEESDDNEIMLDLKEANYLTSVEINKLILLYHKGKKIILKNLNSHIKNTINVMKLNKIFIIE